MSAARRLILSVAGVALLLAPVRAQDERDLDVLLDRLATYLESYEQELSTLVADDRYTQHEQRRGRFPRRRDTEAEVLFLRLPGEAEWFGVRDVKKVDGRVVTRAGGQLSDLTRTKDAEDVLTQAAQIVEASSKHNLGGRRTINMPTVPLEALSARNHVRYIFKVGGTARVAGMRTRQLEFQEFDEPTLIRGTDGSSLWTRGTASIDPETGALGRATLIVSPDRPGERGRRPGLESTVRVEFALDKKLGLLVPRELVESFWIPNGRGSGHGRYSNYRRFTTAGRIIP